MSSILPIKLDDLIHARAVESERLEFKATWNQPIKESVLGTICAFANDLRGLNGGYVVLGIDEEPGTGAPRLPPRGLDGLDLDRVQKEIFGACQHIGPPYQPLLSPEVFQGKQVLVIWAPAGDVRPYQAPEALPARGGAPRHYYVRMGNRTVKAHGDTLTELIRLTARVPFDSRARRDVPLSVVSGLLLRGFLRDVGSRHGTEQIQTEDALRGLRLSVRVNGHEAPTNAALLFFTDNPAPYIPSAHVELAHFGDDAGGDRIERQTILGPLPSLIRLTLQHLERLTTSITEKIPGQAEAHRFVSFPYEAMEEAIVNAVLHRGYSEADPQDPIRIGLYPTRLEITSFPGPVPGLEPEHLLPGARMPQLPLRNPRIGDLLKSIGLAETWHTGVPTIQRRMRENGSPVPEFSFDAARTYFQVTLPAHPGYIALHALREAATLWHTGARSQALARLNAAHLALPGSGPLGAQLIEYLIDQDQWEQARRVLDEAERACSGQAPHQIYLTLARAYANRGEEREAASLLARMPGTQGPVNVQATVDAAILSKRVRNLERAHALFASVEEQMKDDPRALHEYAQTKNLLAGRAHGSARQHIRQRLNTEAAQLLRRVTTLTTDRQRAAWAWFDLARTLSWLRAPEADVRSACERAMAANPDEGRFAAWLRSRQTA